MTDFAELNKSGTGFELLMREIFIKLNYEVKWSGVGPDRGKDLMVTEKHESVIGNTETNWLVQCKHNAVNGKSVGLEDLGDFVSACHDHNVKHYLLACSTQPSSSLLERFNNISVNKGITIHYWDATKIEKILSSIEFYDIFQLFFPNSSKSTKIKIFATSSPNEWILVYKGYYIVLENRIMSSALEWSHKEIKQIISELNTIQSKHLTKHELLMPRKIWFNGKSPEFVWYIDYLYDSYHMKDNKLSKDADELKFILQDGFARNDGCMYFFDITPTPASFSSDHFHENHYDYYDVVSRIRGQDFSFNKKIYKAHFKRLEENIHTYVKQISKAISTNNKFRVLNTIQDSTREIFNLSVNISWHDIFYEKNIDSSSDFFGPRIIIFSEHENELLELFSGMASTIEESHVFFDLVKRFIYGDKIESDDFTYDMKFKVLFAKNYLDYLIKLEGYLQEFATILSEKMNI